MGTSLDVDLCSSLLATPLGLCSPDSRPFLPLLPWMIYLDGQLLGLKHGHLNAYQARPQCPRWELLAFLESPPLQKGTCQFLLRVRNLRRQSLPLVLLLLLQAEPIGMVVRLMEGSVRVAVRPVGGRLGLGNLVVIHQFEPTMGHLLLWLGQFLGISPRWARSPESDGRLTTIYPHLQKFRILASS